jgi:hypothetical protein
MRIRFKSTHGIVSCVLGVVAGAAVFAGSAAAVPQYRQAAPADPRPFACGRVGSYTNGPGRVVMFTTTGGCLDININLTSATAQTFGRSCLNPGTGERCSQWKLLPFGWTTLSTNVRGGTRFSVDLAGNNGQRISYRLAY